LTSREQTRRFDEQIWPHFRAAYNLARWLTRSHEDAEDIVQEAFLRAFSACESLRGDAAKPWLLAIVRNTSLNWIKRTGKLSLASGGDPVLDHLREPSPDPEQSVLMSIDRDEVRRALDQLPVEFREALVLREIEGCSYKEIAEVADIPLGTVMSRLSRGRDCLRRILTSPAKETVT
jgi:RNA polymerase sigma-70 factor (ECF subfamily)